MLVRIVRYAAIASLQSSVCRLAKSVSIPKPTFFDGKIGFSTSYHRNDPQVTGTTVEDSLIIRPSGSPRLEHTIVDFVKPRPNKAQHGRKLPGRFPELARLGKVRGSAIKITTSTPRGISQHLVHPVRSRSSKDNSSTTTADLPSAPTLSGTTVADKVLRQLPVRRHRLFAVHAYPPTLIKTRTIITPTVKKPPGVRSYGLLERKRDLLNVHFIAGKKTVHESAVIRHKVIAKLKQAMRLIVERGMNVEKKARDRDAEAEQAEHLVEDVDDAGLNRWLLADWVYVVQTTLEVYRHPISGLITEMRKTLEHIKREGERLAVEWAAAEQVTDEEPLWKEAREVEEWVRTMQEQEEKRKLEETRDAPVQRAKHASPPPAENWIKDERIDDSRRSGQPSASQSGAFRFKMPSRERGKNGFTNVRK